MAFQHQPGTAMECLSIPIKLAKEVCIDGDGREVMKCGFKIGGGIDQDYTKSPQGYTDNMNGYDFTMVTHRKAVEYIKKQPVLNMLVARKGVTQS